jgi:hypothetical protein
MIQFSKYHNDDDIFLLIILIDYILFVALKYLNSDHIQSFLRIKPGTVLFNGSQPSGNIAPL